MVLFLLFDVETTGLPLVYNASYKQLENWPRIVQISWCICDSTGNGDDVKNYIIKPINFTIPQESSNIHGIYHQEAVQYGHNVADVLLELKKDMNVCEYLVAHNLNFDKQVLLSELYRLNDMDGISTVQNLKEVCTKEESTDFCKLRPYRYGTWKWPRLGELYYTLCGESIDPLKAHNSKYDVEILKKCFILMLNQGIIKKCNVSTLRNGKVYVKNNFDIIIN